MGEIQQRKGFAAGGGDGIDQVKYFTTHFRRYARRVVWGWGQSGRLKRQQKKSVVQFRATEIPVFPSRRLNMDFRMCMSFPEISRFIIDKGTTEFWEKKGEARRGSRFHSVAKS